MERLQRAVSGSNPRHLAYAHGPGKSIETLSQPTSLLIRLEPPKLANFGIAKLVDSLRVSLTVSDYGSRLFSPPERIKPEFDARQDLNRADPKSIIR